MKQKTCFGRVQLCVMKQIKILLARGALQPLKCCTDRGEKNFVFLILFYQLENNFIAF